MLNFFAALVNFVVALIGAVFGLISMLLGALTLAFGIGGLILSGIIIYFIISLFFVLV